jgi:inner membrane protein
VDNLTHSLVGMALAELVQPAAATARQRRVLMTAGIVSANLPDIDLAYTWITPPPLGYLLHHRGYTHTVAGLAVLGLLLPLLFRLWPAARELTGRTTLHGLIAINLVGHVSLDALNSYGVHPLYPFDASWYYGDAIFIFEPLVWIVAGIAAVCNGVSRRTRISIAALLAGLILGMAGAGVVPAVALGSMAVIGSVFLGAVWHARPRMRAGAALGVTATFMAGMFGLSPFVKAQARAAMTGAGDIIDIVATPDPGMPVCWSVIVIAQDRSREQLRTSRGTLSLAPSWYHADRCASHRLAPPPQESARAGPAGNIEWREDVRESLPRLRDLNRDDCRVRAWLQFGRAPVTRNGEIVDVRFDTGIGANFTAMRIAGESACPPHMTRWTAPRAELLAVPHASP